MCSNSSVIPHFLILSHVHTNLSIIPSGKAVTSGDVVCPFQISRQICWNESVIYGWTFTKSPRVNGDSATPLQHDQRKTSTTAGILCSQSQYVVCFDLVLHLFRVCLVLPKRQISMPQRRSSGPMQPLPSSRGMRCRFRKDPGVSTRVWAQAEQRNQ